MDRVLSVDTVVAVVPSPIPTLFAALFIVPPTVILVPNPKAF